MATMVSKIQQDPFAEEEDDDIIHIPTVRRNVDPFDEEEDREDSSEPPQLQSSKQQSKTVRWISQLSCIIPQSKHKQKQQQQNNPPGNSTAEPKVNFTAGRLAAGRALSTVEENLEEDVQSNVFSEHPIPEEDEDWNEQDYALPELKESILNTSSDSTTASSTTVSSSSP